MTETVDISSNALLAIILIGSGWCLAVLALVDAIQRRARGDDAAGTWVVFLAVSLVIVPLAGLCALGYIGAVVFRTPRAGSSGYAATGSIGSRSSRMWAFITDAALLGVPMLTLVWRHSTIDVGERIFDTPGWIPLTGWAVTVVYQIVCVRLWGRTLGKRLAQLEVVTADGATPSWGVAVRRAAPTILGAVPYVGSLAAVCYLPVLWRPDRRGLHDQLAGTVVVRTADVASSQHRLLGMAAAATALAGCVGLAFDGQAERTVGTVDVVRSTVPEDPWENGRPHAENMERARERVASCLGKAAEVGEPVYDFVAMPVEVARPVAEGRGLTMRAVGVDEDCTPDAMSGDAQPDRLNVYLVGGRVVWARLF